MKLCFILALFPHLDVASQLGVCTSQVLAGDVDSHHKCICSVAFSLRWVQIAAESDAVMHLEELPELQITSGEDRGWEEFTCAKLENGKCLFLGTCAET